MISVRDLEFGYKSPVLRGLSFDIDGNLIILGENGSGKSTLLKCLLNLIKFRGEILLNSKSIKKLKRSEISKLISYIPQTHSTPFEYKVIDMVLMSRLAYKNILENYSKNDYQICYEALDRVGILDFKDRLITALSGGERQLVYIARALASRATTILMDEPTNGLDFGNQIKLLELIKELGDKRFIITTHHPRQAKFLGFDILMIKDGAIFRHGGCKNTLTTDNISALYGVDYAKFGEIL